MNLLTPIATALLAAATTTAATGTTPATQPVDAAPGWFGFLSSPVVLIGAVFLITTVLFGNKGKRTDEKQRVAMLKLLKGGDRIQTIGGILGTVVKAEEARVQVKVDESSNVKVWFARNAISKVVETEKADGK